MAADSGQYTPETIARRIAMAEALLAPRKRPITHWAEGLDELAKGALGGYQLNKAEDMERRGRLGAYERIARLLSGDPAPIASSTGTDAIRGAMPALRSEAAPGPGGTLGAEDMDRMARMVNAEAGNQDMTGKQAVANVIMNRSQQSGMPIGGVLDAPGQFEPAMTAGGRSKIAALDPNSRAYQEAEMAALNALEKDPTGGATHFYAPKAQAALGRPEPGWDNGSGQMIGDHRFFKLGYNGAGGQGGGIPAIAQALQPTAQDGSQPPQPPAGAPAAPGGVPVAPPMAQPTGAAPGPVAGPTGGGGTGAGGTGGNNMAAIAAMLTDPWVDPKAAQAAMSLITPNMNIQTLPDGTVVGINPRDGSHKVIMQAPKNPKFVPNVGMDRYGQAQPGFVDELKGTTRLATPEVGPGASAANAPSDPSLVGEDYLKTLDKPRADQVRAIVEGRSNPPGSFALKTPYWQRMMQDATQFEPGFDMTKWSARAATAKDFASGKSAQNITSFNTVLGHLDTLDKAAEKLKNTDYPWANAVINPVKRAAGSKDTQEALSNFNIAKQAVIDELTRAFRGTGGNVHDLVQWEKTINSAGSPTELKAATRQATELLRSRIEALGDTYKRGMNTQRDPVELLSPRAQQTIRRLSGETTPAAGETVPTGFKILKVE